MKSLDFGRMALCSCVAAAMLAGCGVLRQAQDDTPLIGAPGAMPQKPAIARAAALVNHMNRSSYQVLYRFRGLDTHGANPVAGVISVNGTLYGTTEFGGDGCRTSRDSYGCGTVFSVTPRGPEQVLHSFSNEPDGDAPVGGLVDMNGTLYGTTYNGGASGDGTVYSISTSGAEKVLHSFTGRADGAQPVASLIDVNGVLYGTTSLGGTPASGCYCGTVFSVTKSGKVKVLHAFSGNGDGISPQAPLVDVSGTLYGTTSYGGSSGYGTVYSIGNSGVEKVLHSFEDGSDGAYPGPLIDVNGTLYGTTQGGGSDCGCGTVYSITTTGTEAVLYAFTGGSDGKYPQDGVIDVNGTLYGTTVNGGGSGCFGSYGCGTIFTVSTAGIETVLYRFASVFGGLEPQTPLLNVNGKLYGTTVSGGAKCAIADRCGTVFAFKF
jgi:uncharacterized repeat protein (TIGR03803 family)